MFKIFLGNFPIFPILLEVFKSTCSNYEITISCHTNLCLFGIFCNAIMFSRWVCYVNLKMLFGWFIIWILI